MSQYLYYWNSDTEHADIVQLVEYIIGNDEVAGSTPAISTNNGVEKMKTIYFENIRNRERFYCNNTKDIQLIDGVEYLRVFKLGTQRDCLIKKETLKKIPEPK